jgi:hypothetical protein
MPFTEQQWADIERERETEGAGWIFVLSAPSAADRKASAR